MQDQTLTNIPFNVGIVKEQTRKAAEGFWIDCDKVRFRLGKPELIGGWQNVTTPQETTDLIGTPRALETVRALDGQKVAVIGTNSGLFASNLSKFYNITPITTTLAATDSLNTEAGSVRIVVSISAHNLNGGTLIGITSANTTIGGNVLINAVSSVTATYPVSIIDDDSFAFDIATTAAATSTATGGNLTLYLYYGGAEESNVVVNGWGTGVWNGNFAWGTPDSGGGGGGGSFVSPLRLWSLDLWGTEVMAVPTSGPLMLYQPQAGLDAHASIITAAPSINQIVRVAPEARHVVLYGTHDITGDYDPLLIRWCSSEDYTDWTPSLTNTAGEYRLPSRGSEVRSVLRMADRTIILTDTDLFSQNYIGSNDVFGFIRGAENCGAISQNAAVEYKGALYWMASNSQFFKYDGRVQTIPCPILRYVFDNLNYDQASKVCAGVNSRFDEVIWFYPDKTSAENNRYIIYNVLENHWSVGSIARTAWKDSSTYDLPIATAPGNAGLFYHETGYADDTGPLTAYLESAYFALRSGDDIMFSNKVVPDFSNISNNEDFNGLISLSLKARKYPEASPITKGPYLIEETTQRLSTRLRGREFAVRLDSDTINKPWRLGEFRMSIQPDGKR